MITKSDMMLPLVEACPTFEPTWQAFLDEWTHDEAGLDGGYLPLYLALGDLADHLIDMLARRETSAFPANFAVVTRWHVEGDGYVREAATVGLLECIQNTNLHTSTRPEQFRAFLGPVSETWWDKLYGFWKRGELLRE